MAKKSIQLKGIVAIYPANSVGDDIELYTDEARFCMTLPEKQAVYPSKPYVLWPCYNAAVTKAWGFQLPPCTCAVKSLLYRLLSRNLSVARDAGRAGQIARQCFTACGSRPRRTTPRSPTTACPTSLRPR